VVAAAPVRAFLSTYTRQDLQYQDMPGSEVTSAPRVRTIPLSQASKQGDVREFSI
jgi:hypothetical protein